MMKPSETYSQLRQSDDNISTSPKLEAEGLPLNPRHDWTRNCLFILLGILGAVTCLILGYVAHPKAQPTPPTTPKTWKTTSTSELHCGNSSSEARALGCVFDLLTNNWMPQYCADPYTDGEYRAWVTDAGRELGAWAFYHDDKAERQVASEEELSDLVGKHVWTTTENHLAHCVFLARRMHRLVTGEIAAVAHNTFAHTVHCTKAILKALQSTGELSGDVAQIGSTFDVGIVSCLV
jgi:hypothetical protein